MITKGLMSSKSNEWATPQMFYEKLDKEFHFTLDPCSTKENHKCNKFYTKEEYGLKQSWKNEIVFCNPPYGKEISNWVKKAFYENKNGAKVVLLLPARTDTKYFHKYIYGKHTIRFIKGRLKFNDGKTAAPFPSMIVIMN